MRKRRNMKAVFLWVLLTVSMCACTASGSAPETAGTGAIAAPSANEDVKTEITVAKSAALSSMDPQTTGMTLDMEILSATVEGLYRIGSDGTPELAMAKSVEKSEDGLTYTFTLRDAKWNNGEPVTAYDFEYAMKRSCDPEVLDGDSNDMIATLGVKNGKEILEGTTDYTTLGVTALDDKTLVIEMDHPVPYFESLLSYAKFLPTNQAFVEEKGDMYAMDAANCLANGPYVLTEWDVGGTTWTLEKNEDYYAADTVTVDTIHFQVIQDTQQAVLAFENGDIQYTQITGEQVAAYEDSPAFHSEPYGVISFIFPNFANEYLANDDIRKALSFAIDKEKICSDVLKDGSTPAYFMAAKGLSFDENGADFRDGSETYQEYEPEKALEYWNKGLEELGVSQISFDFLISDTESAGTVGAFIQNCMESTLPGLTINLKSMPGKLKMEKISTGDYDMAVVGWESNYPDPLNHLELFKIGGNCNLNGYVSEEYTDIIERATYGDLTLDNGKRWEELHRAETILLEQDAAIYPLYQNSVTYLQDPALTGMSHHLCGAEFSYFDLSYREE